MVDRLYPFDERQRRRLADEIGGRAELESYLESLPRGSSWSRAMWVCRRAVEAGWPT